MKESGVVTESTPGGKITDGSCCRRKSSTRLIIAAAGAGLLVVAGFISWFLLYVTALNPGD